MGGNPDSDEYEEDGAEEIAADDEGDLDRAIKDMEIAKRRSVKVGEPAWRRLEQRLEQKRTAELISDLEDYDLGAEDVSARQSSHDKARPR
jgi:DNA polymerase III delta prime subunit